MMARLRAFLAELKQTPLRCWLGFHDGMQTAAVGELYLRCGGCGRRTDGWQVAAKALRYERAEQTPDRGRRLILPIDPDLTAIVSHTVNDQVLADLTVHDLELAAILADVDERRKGRRIH